MQKIQKKLTESLTTRIFLITVLILLGAGAITFGLVAWSTPSTYTAVVNDDLARQVDALVAQLANTNLEDSGPVIDAFIRSSGGDATLVGPSGQVVSTIQPAYGEETAKTKLSDGTSSLTWLSGTERADHRVTVTMSEQDTILADVYFADQEELYSLYVVPRIKAENLAVRALIQMAPWLLLVLLAFSLLCALVYSRYITRPIVRLSGIASKMAELDFHWKCGERRTDEIGKLGDSLDQMASRLSTALKELESANHALQGEVALEREQDRQRMAFFSAASHELKTPITILKGQLAGMLEGVDVYRDRDKYLFRSLQITGRMEHLIQEMLSISRMETGIAAIQQEPVALSALIERQLTLDVALFQQREQHLVSQLTPGVIVTGDASLLGKAVGNLLSNASVHSPKGAELRVWCGRIEGRPALTVENTGVHIHRDALPHLFEAFYREETSRNRSSGGSGLGLYLTRIILERHHASCVIENTEEGVRAVVRFSA